MNVMEEIQWSINFCDGNKNKVIKETISNIFKS